MRNRTPIITIAVFCLITFALLSCQNTAGSNGAVTSLPKQRTTLTTTAQQTFSFTPSPSNEPVTDTPTPTNTIRPTLTNTPTARPTLTRTFTPHPVIDLSDSDKAKIMDVLNETDDCRLPCWNGLTPGKSTFGENQGFFARLGYPYDRSQMYGNIHNGGYEQIMKDYPSRFPEPYLRVLTTWENDVNQKVEIDGLENLEQHSMQRIVKTLGIPDAIYGIAGPGDWYRFALIYSDRGVVIAITGLVHQIQPSDTEKPYGVCILDDEKKVFTINLYSVEQGSLPVVDNYIADIRVTTKTGFFEFDWAQELGMTNEELMDELLNNPEVCIPFK